jgi:hypothetical protein
MIIATTRYPLLRATWWFAVALLGWLTLLVMASPLDGCLSP